MSRWILAAALLWLVSAVTPAVAQDSNYWTNKYGTKSILLNGVVTGGPVDLSTLYYNPGALALLEDPGIVLTVKAFEFANISLPDAGGKGVDLDDPRSSVLPTFVGGLVPFQFLGSDALGYSLFPRQGLRANITGRSMTPRDVLPSPGLEDYFVETRLEQDLDETWIGATWSRKLSETVGIGLSPYVALRNQKSRLQILSQALGSDSTGAVSTTVVGYQYNHYRLLARAGASFEREKFSVGFTITTPGIKILGSGDAGTDRFRAGQDLDGDGEPDNAYAVSFQQDLSSTWKSPLSIGAGVIVPMGRSTLYLSGEWFQKVDAYEVLDVAPVVDEVSGSTVPFQVVQQAKSVTNGGIGWEFKFNPKFTGYASFSTDFSTAEDGKSDTAVSNWDIYLVTAGTTFAVGKTEFTLGAGYAWGNNEARLPASLEPIAGDIGVSPTLGNVRYRSTHLIFGFAI